MTNVTRLKDYSRASVSASSDICQDTSKLEDMITSNNTPYSVRITEYEFARSETDIIL